MQQAELEQRYTSPRGLWELWAGVLLAPLAWTLHLTVSYFLATVLCESEWNAVGLAVSLALLAAAGAGLWFAWRNYVRTGREWPRGDVDSVLVRSRFFSIGGLMLSLLSMLLIVAQSVPLLVLPPCR